MDCSLSVSSVHGIFQARILEWVAISYSKIKWQLPLKSSIIVTVYSFHTHSNFWHMNMVTELSLCQQNHSTFLKVLLWGLLW